MDIIFKLFKSRSPIVVSFAAILFCVLIVKIGFGIANSANAYVSQFETKESHKADIDARVEGFKKDVRIAILENNSVLLEQIKKELRKQ